jgi:hypothetical protein
MVAAPSPNSGAIVVPGKFSGFGHQTSTESRKAP